MPKRYAMTVSNSWKTRTILGGAMVGAFAGLVAAYLLTRRADREGRETAITPGEGVQLGFLVVGLLRAIAGLGSEK
jgi:hypothetical protein